MTPQRYAEITRLCQAALELNASQRDAFLTQVCAGDDELRREIDSLIEADESIDSFIDKPALDMAAQIFAREHQPLRTGQRLSHYEIRSLLGAGGMGEVYLAEDDRLHRKVALKLLPALFTQDAERVQRFKKEAQAASALNHPNILTIHDIGVEASLHFIATEYVEGRTLRQLLQSGPLPADQVIEIAVQLADALSAAHNAGIIHRDIKPENVMRRPDGYVKVLDFGLAKLRRDEGEGMRDERMQLSHPSSLIPHPSLTSPGKVMGTISYMSPEQALGQDVDSRTDIFSLGAVLYELLTGVQPFKGNSEAATYNAILNIVPPPLSKSLAGLPPELSAIVERALEKDRDLRYQTAADLRAALKRLQRDSASHSAAVAVPAAVAQPRRKWAALAVLLLVIVVGSVLAWRSWQKKEPALGAAKVNDAPRNVSYAQVTDQAGMDYFPSLSPDGRALAYARHANGHWDVWLQSIGQNDAVNLTNDAANDGADDLQPAFSPDGKQIAFRSSRAGGGLFVLELATRAMRKINGEGFNPTWSPDGTEIAYGTVNLTNIEARAASQIWAVRLDNGARRLIVSQDSVQPAWSPDGRYIAFFGNQTNGQLDVMTVAASGGAPIKLTTDAAIDWNPCWAADGKSLYFTSDRGGNTNLWRIAIDENTGQPLGAPEPFTTPATDTYHLSISRDGSQLAYVQRNKQRNLQALALDPVTGTVRGTPHAITRGTGSSTHPAISPDGQWLAYSTAGNPQTDLYVMRTDGSGLRRLTNDIAKDHLPRWSPDGKRIAFFSDREGKNESWAVPADGSGQLEQLTFVGAGRAVFPNYSPDGNFLAYTLLRQGSFLIDLRKSWQQQTPQPLTFDGKLDPSLSVSEWSPDGQKIACHLMDSDPKRPPIAVYWLATPNAPARLQPIEADGEYPTWFNDSQRLLFVEETNRLSMTDLRTNAKRSLFTFGEQEIVEYLSFARDNRTLYYSVSTIESDIWLIKLKHE